MRFLEKDQSLLDESMAWGDDKRLAAASATSSAIHTPRSPSPEGGLSRTEKWTPIPRKG